jgi:hypothetical protein
MRSLILRLFNIAALVAVAGFMGVAPAMGDVLFTDLGPTGNVYDSSAGWVIRGGSAASPLSTVAANLFTVPGAGNQAVSQLDLAVLNTDPSVHTFYASIWTDDGGVPGTQVPGAYWNLSTDDPSQSCCGLVSITGITGVFLTGGQSYFLVLGPLDLSDGSWDYIASNNQGITGLSLYSYDGGSGWLSNGTQSTGAFDVLGSPAPEPDSFLVLGTGVVGILAVRRFRSRHPSQR